MSPRILITNAVPLNGGDEALLRATLSSLSARFPGSKILVLCSDVERCREELPDLNLDSDLERVSAPKGGFARAIERAGRIRVIWRFARLFERSIARRQAKAEREARERIIQHYRKAEIVISAPGGFLHDFYPIEDRLKGLELALDLGKPVVLFAQSVGPFWKPESLKRVPEVFNRVSAICVRDDVSKGYLTGCGVLASKIHEAADAAFLYRNLAPELHRTKTGPIQTVGMCFREWPLGDAASAERTLAKGVVLARMMLDEGRNLVFLSTCQGTAGYLDDSLMAVEIVKRLPADLRGRCRIDRKRYDTRALIEQFGNCDAFIGMRLHACILSMLGGTPAMGLGYEDKTESIFRQLGLEQYQTRFDGEVDQWLACARGLMLEADKVRQALPEALDRLAKRAATSLDVVARFLPQGTGHEPHSPSPLD